MRSGKEKDEGAKFYSITNDVVKASLSFCCLRKVKYRNLGKKVITLDSGENYEELWTKILTLLSMKQISLFLE